MIIVAAVLLLIGTIVFVLGVRSKDLPPPPLPSPFQKPEEMKARIYENLRDLQFEYRLGKLSDEDYQKAKLGLQAELAQVLAEIEKLEQQHSKRAAASTPSQPAPAKSPLVCPSCGAKFTKSMKFCGECGKPMGAA
jgi:rubrerythrin